MIGQGYLQNDFAARYDGNSMYVFTRKKNDKWKNYVSLRNYRFSDYEKITHQTAKGIQILRYWQNIEVHLPSVSDMLSMYLRYTFDVPLFLLKGEEIIVVRDAFIVRSIWRLSDCGIHVVN